MQADLVITTQADFDLYEHLNAACYTLYRKKRSYLITFVTAAVLGGYLVASSLLEKDMFLLCVVTPLWIIAFLAMSYYMLRTRSVAKRAAKRAYRMSAGDTLLIRYSFYPDHFGIATDDVEVESGYQGISNLVETSEFYLIFMGPANAHCIKKRDLGASNVDIFREYMQDKTGQRFNRIKY